jgi:hypothetical protein
MTWSAAPVADRRRGGARARRHGAGVVALALAPPRGSATRRATTHVALVGGAALVGVTALIHLYLWADGYRHIPTIGPLFLAQGVAGLGLAVALVGYPRIALAVLAAGFLLATIAGLLVSASAGLFGFMDTLDAPWASTSLAVEAAGAALLAVAVVLPLGAT